MAKNINDYLQAFKENPKNVKFQDLVKVCDALFEKARQSGSSHRVYKLHGRAILG